MWSVTKSAIPSNYMQVYDPWNRVLKKVPDSGLLLSSKHDTLRGGKSYTNAALKGGRSYTNAALKGGRSYTNAALKGGRSYTKAALKGGRSYTNAALKGGDATDDLAKLAGELGPTLMNSLSTIAVRTGENIKDLLSDPEKLMKLATQYAPTAISGLTSLYSKMFGAQPSDFQSQEEIEDDIEDLRYQLKEYIRHLKETDTPKYRAFMKRIFRKLGV